MACWHTHASPTLPPALGCRYPRNAKLLRSYGRFLENVKNDPWTAAKYYAEAEKQARARAHARNNVFTWLHCNA